MPFYIQDRKIQIDVAFAVAKPKRRTLKNVKKVASIFMRNSLFVLYAHVRYELTKLQGILFFRINQRGVRMGSTWAVSWCQPENNKNNKLKTVNIIVNHSLSWHFRIVHFKIYLEFADKSGSIFDRVPLTYYFLLIKCCCE